MHFLYARVSTSDQTAAHQLGQARAAGFEIDDDSLTNSIEFGKHRGAGDYPSERVIGRSFVHVNLQERAPIVICLMDVHPLIRAA